MWLTQTSLNIYLILLLLMCQENKFHRWKVDGQLSAFRPTVFDNSEWRLFFHLYRNITMMMAGRTGLKTRGRFLQKQVPDSVPFPCDVTLGRSREPPTSVHKLRPGKRNNYPVLVFGGFFYDDAFTTFIFRATVLATKTIVFAQRTVPN